MTESLQKFQHFPLSPYPHELNPEGTDCAPDCPACRWVEEQANPTKE